MNGKEFAKWMDEAGIDLNEAASHFGVSPQTIYNWRSTSGVPASREEWVRNRMRDYIASRAFTVLPDRITLEVTADQFDAWNQAALSEGKLLRAWAIDVLDQQAAEDEQTGSGQPFNPLQSLKVAEPSHPYGEKAED